MSNDSPLYSKNIEQLLDNILSKDLPKGLSVIEKVPHSKFIDLMTQIQDDRLDLFKISNATKLVTGINLKAGETPRSVFNAGAESIDYIMHKSGVRFRTMSIPHYLFYIAFAYNTLQVYDHLFAKIYFEKDERLNKVIRFSNSPIINITGEFEVVGDFYENEIVNLEKGMFHNEYTKDKYFEYYREIDYKREGTKLYTLKTDIESFYKNIYTHNLARLVDRYPYSKFKNDYTSDYFSFLDQFNMKVNNNQTTGILIGPLSSAISAELIMLSFDNSIYDFIEKNEIEYTRYVDDMHFYSNSENSLERLYTLIQKNLGGMKFETKEEKTSITKGFSRRKQADIRKIIFDFEQLDVKSHSVMDITPGEMVYIKDYILALVDHDDISTIKVFITLLTSKFNKSEIVINKPTLEILINFVIKLALIQPELVPGLMKLLEALIEFTGNEESFVSTILYKHVQVITDQMSGTLMQIWIYYLLNKNLDKENRESLFSSLLATSDQNDEEINPMVLITFVSNNEDLNERIQKYIKDVYTKKDQGNIYNSISYSKWWIVILELHMKNKEYFKELFVSKTGEIQYKRLGLFVRLLG